jgi:hypothetical protein
MSLKGKTALSSALFFAAVMSASVSLAAEKPAKLENIAGSELKRVVLTPKAAERLAIQTGEVREEPVNRWLSVEGLVEAVSQTASLGSQPGATMSDAPPVQVRVPKLDPTRLVGQAVPVMTVGRDDDDDDGDDDDDDDREASARGGTVVGALPVQPKPADAGTGAPAEQGPTVLVVPIGTGHKVSRLRATLAKLAADGGGPNAAQYYLVDNKGHNLQPGQQVHVRVPQAGSGTPQPVIPYSSVIYDYKGGAWTYTTPEPLTFVRHRIEVEYVDGNKAILKEGPPVGTKIVTAGAAELMGVELKFGH